MCHGNASFTVKVSERKSHVHGHLLPEVLGFV